MTERIMIHNVVFEEPGVLAFDFCLDTFAEDEQFTPIGKDYK